MNLFDVVILVLAVSAGVGGYRLGLVARALSWFFMAIGIVITARFLPDNLVFFRTEPHPDDPGKCTFDLWCMAFPVAGQTEVDSVMAGREVGRRSHVAGGLVWLSIATKWVRRAGPWPRCSWVFRPGSRARSGHGARAGVGLGCQQPVRHHGQRSAGRVEILAGLRAGETIATRNAFLLKAEFGKGAGEEH